MKETIAAIIAVIFTVSLCLFTGIGMVPVEVFCSLATGAIVFWFKNDETTKLKKQIDGFRYDISVLRSLKK